MNITIVGARAIGSHLAQLLSKNNHSISLMDDDESCLESLSKDLDVMMVHGSANSVKDLKLAGAQNADLFIAVTPHESENTNACILAKALGAKKTVAKVDSYEYMEDEIGDFFRKIGIDRLIYPEMLAAEDICNGLKMSWVRQRWDVYGSSLVMLSIKLRDACTILNKSLKEICGPDDPYHVVAIKRQGETIIPGGDDSLELYDLAYFMTTKNYIPYMRKIVGKEDYVDVKNIIFMGGGGTAVRALLNIPEYMNAKVIEQDEDRCEYLADILPTDVTIIHGDGRDLDLLQEEGIRNTQAFVALTGSTETNILACLTAKRLGVRKTVAAVENTDYISMAESLDIGTLINKKTIAASNIYQMMLDADVNNVRFLMTANADVVEITAHENSKVTKNKIYELGLPKGITLGGLVRNNEGMLISGSTQIQAGDVVMAFCHDVDIKRLEKFFN
jgi:trk system potassium uptake protein TrkA